MFYLLERNLLSFMNLTNNGQQHLKCLVVLTLIQEGVVLWSTTSQMCVDKQTKHKQWSTTSQILSGIELDSGRCFFVVNNISNVCG
ncbi:hypothetical protein JHK86_006918 [Glycine max]|nr:hypothetical protein JHK86_006918 [Glycine max]